MSDTDEETPRTPAAETLHPVPSRIVQGTIVDGRCLPEEEGPPRDPISDEVADLVAKTLAETDRNPGFEPDKHFSFHKPFLDEIPSRMLNEYVYCPRLFYYEFVEGVFLHNADTRKGLSAHSRVDRAKGGSLPTKQAGRKLGVISEEAQAADSIPEVIHSRSVSLGSDELGVTAKLDLVEVRQIEGDLLSETIVCPVEYKVGSPKEDNDGLPSLWDTDKMQLGLQILLLRENGYECNEGVLYYRGTRQRVRLPITQELEDWIRATIAEARLCAGEPKIPLPLNDSPKCVRCSLAPVCLPDETKLLLDGPGNANQESRIVEAKSPAGPVRRLIAKKDVKRVVYLTTPGIQVGISKEVLRCSQKGKLLEEIPLSDVLHLGLFGNVGVTTPAIRELVRREIPISWFSTGGWFYGMMRGHGLTNVLTRIEQFSVAQDQERCLELARDFVRGKIRNSRVLLMRNHTEPPPRVIKRLKGAADTDAANASSIAELLGIEGAAASLYFSQFQGMLKPNAPDDIDGENPGDAQETESESGMPSFDFDFNGRNRRPPRDPVNALLSLSYSLLAKECTVAALAVGMDPYVGFYHQPRHGRPALALDLMEEFRPIIADSAVLKAINNRIVTPKDFVRAGNAVNLTPAGRKRFLQIWERRVNSTITHPLFGYQVSYRRALELQFRLLARVLTGEIESYTPFMTR